MATSPKVASTRSFDTVGFSSGFRSDPRWQLVERILQTSPFQKSMHLPALLSYLAEHSLRGNHQALTERQIGISVFGKPVEYSTAEDSAVRVHVRQLRLRLHEFYACEGRNESIVIDIPKGGYSLEFHSTPTEIEPNSKPVPDLPSPRKEVGSFVSRNMIAVIAVLIALVCALGWYRAATTGENSAIPWPLNAVMQKNQQTFVVVADTNSMLRLLGKKELTLEEYLQPGFLGNMIPPNLDENVSRLVHYISDSQLTSYSDLVTTSTLLRLAGSGADHLVIRSARDLNERDLEQGNYVFIGGQTSNPWVALFEDKLNFQVVEDSVGGRMYFLNKKPQAGEQLIYEGLEHTGSTGEDYATISLLPNNSGPGNVLILQGLRQEGTEALGILLADAANRAELKQALNIPSGSKKLTYFEALIRARALAGAPVSIHVVATRILGP